MIDTGKCYTMLTLSVLENRHTLQQRRLASKSGYHNTMQCTSGATKHKINDKPVTMTKSKHTQIQTRRSV